MKFHVEKNIQNRTKTITTTDAGGGGVSCPFDAPSSFMEATTQLLGPLGYHGQHFENHRHHQFYRESEVPSGCNPGSHHPGAALLTQQLLSERCPQNSHTAKLAA